MQGQCKLLTGESSPPSLSVKKNSPALSFGMKNQFFSLEKRKIPHAFLEKRETYLGTGEIICYNFDCYLVT